MAPALESAELPITLSPMTHHPRLAAILSGIRAHSSVGQSARFTSVRSQVQVLLRPPPAGYRLMAINSWQTALASVLHLSDPVVVFSSTSDFRLRFPPPYQVPFRVTRPGRRAASHAPEPRGLTGPGPMRTIAPRSTRPAPGPLAAARQRTFARRCGGSESDQVGGRNGAGTDAGR